MHIEQFTIRVFSVGIAYSAEFLMCCCLSGRQPEILKVFARIFLPGVRTIYEKNKTFVSFTGSLLVIFISKLIASTSGL